MFLTGLLRSSARIGIDNPGLYLCLFPLLSFIHKRLTLFFFKMIPLHLISSPHKCIFCYSSHTQQSTNNNLHSFVVPLAFLFISQQQKSPLLYSANVSSPLFFLSLLRAGPTDKLAAELFIPPFVACCCGWLGMAAGWTRDGGGLSPRFESPKARNHFLKVGTK